MRGTRGQRLLSVLFRYSVHYKLVAFTSLWGRGPRLSTQWYRAVRLSPKFDTVRVRGVLKSIAFSKAARLLFSTSVEFCPSKASKLACKQGKQASKASKVAFPLGKQAFPRVPAVHGRRGGAHFQQLVLVR